MSHGAIIIANDILVVFFATSFILLLLFLLIVVCQRKAVKSEGNTLSNKFFAKAYSLTEIDVATDGFNSQRIIGMGRLGTVYVASLARDTLVVVKRIHSRLVLANPGFGFSSVVKSLSLADHPNVVPIIGFSEAPGERIILMEFVGMVGLDFYLHRNSEEASLLDWPHRLRVAAQAARGLEYLHEGMAPHVVHGCIKASNILIDEKFCARVCDYGLSFLGSQEKRGLAGYVDEEYWGEGGACPCKESDVYAFGVVLLEILSGRRSDGGGLLVDWALPLIKGMKFGEILDPRIGILLDLKPLIRMAKVALACVGNSRKSRPSMAQVAAILNNLEMGPSL